MEIIIPETKIDYARLQQAKSIFGKGSRPKSIYHYTSIGGLQGILQSKTLRFTNIKYMNDKEKALKNEELYDMPDYESKYESLMWHIFNLSTILLRSVIVFKVNI